LNITGTGVGTISFSFQANTAINIRSTQITVLGESVTVTQLGDLPATITKTGGSGQSAPAGQPFASALQVQVKDAAGNGVQGAQVISLHRDRRAPAGHLLRPPQLLHRRAVRPHRPS
jgi:hypothetical protein